MRVTLHINPSLKHHKEYGDLFVAGLKVHKIIAQVQKGYVPTECNVAVIWGWHRRAQRIIDHQESKGRHVIVLERGYFGDRLNDCTSVALIGTDGLPYFNNDNSSDDRFKESGIQLKPWKPGNDYVVVAGQIPNDTSVDTVNIRNWVYAQISAIREKGFKVVYKPHPDDTGSQRVPAETITMRGDLDEVLKRAKCIVTFNSTVGVDAMIAGVPVIAMDQKSRVYSIAGHDLDYLKKKGKIDEPGREQWAHDLAYCQWSKKELANGKAWAHIMGLQDDAKAQQKQVNQDR